MSIQTRREFLKSVALAAASAGAAAVFPGCGDASTGGRSSAGRKRPNILFIMSDDHASHALSCYGSVINKTPNLDRIANEGMRFNNAFCTNSICGPCRATILTSKYSHLNGFYSNATTFDPTQLTFPKVLQKVGYETAMIGKWHLRTDPTGFDYWNILPGQGLYYNPVLIEMGERKKHHGYVTNIITDISIDWLKNRDSDKPFCLMYHHKAPHRNWQPNLEHLNVYDDADLAEPDTMFDDYKTRCAAAREQEMTLEKHLTEQDLKLTKPYGLDEEQLKVWNAAYGPKNEAFKKANLQGKDLVRWKYQRYMKDYLRCIASVDDNVGRMLDYLDEAGLAEDTIVIYTSDQGFYLGDHGWFDKRFMYEESLKMPLLVRYPREIRAGAVNDDIVLNLDFGPTFLDYAGVDKPDEMQGESMRKVLRGRTPRSWRKSMYYHYYEYPGWHMVKRHYGVRTERYKLIHFYHDIDAWEFYDLKKDPDELNNLYENPAYANIIKRLKFELRRLQKKYGDSDELAQKILKEHPQGSMPRGR